MTLYNFTFSHVKVKSDIDYFFTFLGSSFSKDYVLSRISQKER